MTSPAETRPRRGGRPTREQAARLDLDVREHALRLFLDHGYEGTSMEAIAQAAGTTKASLYARYPSKDAVFTAVFGWAMGRPDWPAPEPEPPDLDDLEGALAAIGRAALRRALDPSMVKMSRIAIAQADRFPELARMIQNSGTGNWWRRRLVADLLRRHAERGAIALADDPDRLADLFLGLVSGGPARLASFGIVRDPDERERHLQAAVRLFLRAVRP
ncbi:TetR/AcrR family transcriptional regulator [Frankia sp. CNm7]|uniref:TetR/AcrR family transcriptional regulator n=1 Tax=Frankia nepalensis TaxID=1836974 RepID=A0A937UMV4_9ACTN|nr:TetR/AcrR family transcriptional regulator [Frankia nepalensis]MBL7502751.1 TetR/AcrR family transcriptional regulator [Frankia nepalensis]MBL7515489.1 TetR/AcrR family transcriptional regulator [Frankia nepalensis]MBL7523280.1 TetR/AcrR family transcriptional regulator [Frankia nepalensis]MBL7627257.1 TetR/AcrR family transcriptional regulator [Frankia nepalensis]